MTVDNKKFQEMEKVINDFAKDLFFKNAAISDLVSINAQKDLLTLKETKAKKMQEIRLTLLDFCQPQVKAIIEESQNTKNSEADFQLVKKQVHQLLQNYDNLLKIIDYVKDIREQKGHELTHQWKDMEARVAEMNIKGIKQIKSELNEQ